jgi:hypothetical protein
VIRRTARRDHTKSRVDLTRERRRYWQRLEKLLEDALIKVSCVASTSARPANRSDGGDLLTGNDAGCILYTD